MHGVKTEGMETNLVFRRDIQGMRALAVLLVICSHAGLPGFSGGFVGVDVFFVISGYLIIGMLFRTADQSRSISLRDFYARRARRILPAATLVLVVTTLLAALKWPFLRSIEVATDAGWASVFLANFRFASVGTDYFAAGQEASPLRHFWSLSVEEQFYLVIPWIFLLMTVMTFKIFRNNGPTMLYRLAVTVLGTISLGSFLWGVYSTSTNPVVAYFSTPARAWELGLGGLVALFMVNPSERSRSLKRWQIELIGWVGFSLIVFASWDFDGSTPFPGVFALIPVLGAATILLIGGFPGAEKTLLAGVLSWRPVRLIGDWSYSLYLWHWPLLLFAHAEWGERLTKLQLLGVLAATFVLSALSYYFVEEPFRRRRRNLKLNGVLLLYPASLALVFSSIFAAHLIIRVEEGERANNPPISVGEYKQLSEDPVIALVQSSVKAAKVNRPIPGKLVPELGEIRSSIAPLGNCDYREGMRRLCPMGDQSSDRVIVVVGDSHARAWGPSLTRLGERLGYVVYQLPLTGCPASFANRPDPESGGHWMQCEDFNKWVRSQVADLRPELTFISNNAYRAVIPVAEEDAGLARELAVLRQSSKRVVMLVNTPVVGKLPGVCLSQRNANLGDCLMVPDRQSQVRQGKFAQIAKASGVEHVDAAPWFCAYGMCPSVIGAFVPLRDKDHISVPYAEYLSEPLAKTLGLTSRGANK